MKQLANTNSVERIVVKQRSTILTGVERVSLSCHVIGMVLSGEKYIQQEDQTVKIPKGHLFFMGQGVHFVEDLSAANTPFTQILFHYTTQQLQHAMMHLEANMLKDSMVADGEQIPSVASAEPSKITKNFFESVDVQYENRGFVDDSIREYLKLAELIYDIVKYESGDILRCVALSMDSNRANFDRIIYDNIFVDKRVEELAQESNRSCTSFKKDFHHRFKTSPHRWYQKQRLDQACLLLNTTSLSIAQIGEMCIFPNPSHFIKIFKRHFGVTPAVYRANHRKQTT